MIQLKRESHYKLVVLICRGGSPWPPLLSFCVRGDRKEEVATGEPPYKLVVPQIEVGILPGIGRVS